MASRGSSAGRGPVRVTESARSFLASQLAAQGAPKLPGTCFRLQPGDGGRTVTALTPPSPDDLLVRRGDRVVLAIERGLAEDLRGNTLDVELGERGAGALIVLPTAEADATDLPEERELVELPYFVLLTLGTRCARYVEPLLATWGEATEPQLRAVAEALGGVEELVQRGDTPEREALWGRSAEALDRAVATASELDTSGAPAEVVHAVDCTAELADAVHPGRSRTRAARAVRRSMEAARGAVADADPGSERALLRRIGRDLATLRGHVATQGLTDVSGVPAELFDE